MTLDGTNTWVLREPGAAQALVVDPGPLDEATWPRARGVARPVRGWPACCSPTATSDHSEGAGRFAELSGAPRPRARPGAAAGRRGLGRGRRRARRRPRGPGRGHARAHRRLAVASCCRRTARCSPATPCSDAARPSWRTPTGGSATTWTSLDRLHDRGGGRRVRRPCCPGTGRCWRTRSGASRLPGAPGGAAGAGARGGGAPGADARARSSSSSTPTSTGRCGRPPS